MPVGTAGGASSTTLVGPGSGGALTSGGAATVGGVSNGGRPSPGSASTNVGTSALGGANQDGTVAGEGGTSQGGTSQGGTSQGGSASGGGSPNGGSASGGKASGGTVAGGASPGGSSPKGGANTGGANTGGANTGGANTGTANCRIVGRTDVGAATGSLRFEWPGVNIHCAFTGTQVSMDLGAASKANRFTVAVDGGTTKTVTTAAGQSSLQLASGLANGTHEIVIWRNTEASPGGTTEFVSLSNFGTGGALLAPTAAPDRRIEVIGDSISAGAGVEGASTTCSPDIDAYTNNYLAYGSVAARAVKADLVTIAWSGIGVYRSYSSSDPTMPTRYPYAIPSASTAWDFTKYQPHVVIFNLGTNDFGAGDPGTAYEAAYVSFIRTVRSKYASAKFVLIDMYGGDRLTRINNVISTLKSGGETSVEMLSFSSVPNNNTACNQHPNAAAHAAMGALLTTRLKSLMGW